MDHADMKKEALRIKQNNGRSNIDKESGALYFQEEMKNAFKNINQIILNKLDLFWANVH